MQIIWNKSRKNSKYSEIYLHLRLHVELRIGIKGTSSLFLIEFIFETIWALFSMKILSFILLFL